MSSILDLLNSDVGKQIIGGASAQSGQSADKTASVLNMALPFLLGAMKKNSASPEGAAGVLGALTNKHDGSILDNLGGLFEGGVDDAVQQDGAGILGHILGGSQPKIENALSQKSGMDAGAVGQILKVAAPILMGILGKETRQNNVSDSNGLGNLLGGLMGSGQQKEEQSFIESLLDADGDGSIIDDVAGMVLSGNKKKGGLGGLLGGLFRK
jgi:hypothetical protein